MTVGLGGLTRLGSACKPCKQVKAEQPPRQAKPNLTPRLLDLACVMPCTQVAWCGVRWGNGTLSACSTQAPAPNGSIEDSQHNQLLGVADGGSVGWLFLGCSHHSRHLMFRVCTRRLLRANGSARVDLDFENCIAFWSHLTWFLAELQGVRCETRLLVPPRTWS